MKTISKIKKLYEIGEADEFYEIKTSDLVRIYNVTQNAKAREVSLEAKIAMLEIEIAEMKKGKLERVIYG